MRRWARTWRAAVVLLGASAAMLLPAAPAGAGGATCHQPRIEGAGTRVEMQEFCFGPTVLKVEPGTEVTWVNRDEAPHVVAGLGLEWGTLDMVRQGGTFSATFAEPGLYPYTCSLHPGMNGLVVVGKSGAAGGTTDDVSRSAAAVLPAASHGGGRSSPFLPWKGAAIAGFALFIVSLVALLRARAQIAAG